MTNIVAPSPRFKGDASTVMVNLSSHEGIVRQLGSFKASFADTKEEERAGDQLMWSAPFKPLMLSSKGLRREEHHGTQREIALNAPKNDLIPVQVRGSGVLAKGDSL